MGGTLPGGGRECPRRQACHGARAPAARSPSSRPGALTRAIRSRHLFSSIDGGTLMTVDPIARLVAANPVSELPRVESPERLRCLIEDDACVLDLGESPNESPRSYERSRLRRRMLIAIPLCVAASVVGVVLSSGPSGPGVNVAAAAYAATSPRAGIVEAVLLTRI